MDSWIDNFDFMSSFGNVELPDPLHADLPVNGTVAESGKMFSPKQQFCDAFLEAPNDRKRKWVGCFENESSSKLVKTEKISLPTPVEPPVDPEVAALRERSIQCIVQNVVSVFNCRCHLNLRKVALEGVNVIYKRENGVVMNKLRRPRATAHIRSSGKIVIIGASSEGGARRAARKVARRLQHMSFPVKFCDYRVVNMLVTGTFGFNVRLNDFYNSNAKHCEMEAELSTGCIYRNRALKAVVKVFSTGSFTCTAPSFEAAEESVQIVYKLAIEHRVPFTAEQLAAAAKKSLGRSKLEPSYQDTARLRHAAQLHSQLPSRPVRTTPGICRDSDFLEEFGSDAGLDAESDDSELDDFLDSPAGHGGDANVSDDEDYVEDALADSDGDCDG